MDSNQTHISMAAFIAIISAVFFVTLWTSDRVAANASSDLVTLGNKRWATGNLDGAQLAFEQAIRTDSNAIDAYMKLAALQLSRNDLRHSTQTYQHVIGLDPQNSKAWIALGICYLHSGKKELALSAFDEAMKIEPNRTAQLAPVMAKLNEPR